jgi:N-acyl-D-aspartate/D-glutamate deacylase
VPVRQWVLTLPYRLRYRLVWDQGLTRAVLGVSERERLRAAVEAAALARDAGWDRIRIAGCPARPAYEGRTIADIAGGLGVSGGEAVIEILRQAEAEADMILFMMSEDNVERGSGIPGS